MVKFLHILKQENEDGELGQGICELMPPGCYYHASGLSVMKWLVCMRAKHCVETIGVKL